MVVFLMRLQGCFTNNPCFLCLWDRESTGKRTEKALASKTDTTGETHIQHEPLVNPHKVLFPPRHIKLGVMKQFVIVVDKESAAFKHLQDLFPKLSGAKVKAGIFT